MILYLVLSIVAAACFYGATSHQRIISLSPSHRRVTRGCGTLLLISAIAVAMPALGFWAALCAVFTAFMLGCVALPFLVALLAKQDERHVG
jgi:hypothetical protein